MLVAFAVVCLVVVGLMFSIALRPRVSAGRFVATAVAVDVAAVLAVAAHGLGVYAAYWLLLAAFWNYLAARSVLRGSWLPDIGLTITWAMMKQRHRDRDRLKADGFYAWAVKHEPKRPIMLAECGINGTIEGNTANEIACALADRLPRLGVYATLQPDDVKAPADEPSRVGARPSRTHEHTIGWLGRRTTDNQIVTGITMPDLGVPVHGDHLHRRAFGLRIRPDGRLTVQTYLPIKNDHVLSMDIDSIEARWVHGERSSGYLDVHGELRGLTIIPRSDWTFRDVAYRGGAE